MLQTDIAESEADQIIKNLKLQPHPEGGFYALTFQSSDTVQSTDKGKYNDETRYAGSATYYLLKENDFSAWHSLKSDEMWHYYKGSPVKIHVIDCQGNHTTHLLGDALKNKMANFQVVVTAGNWFAAELEDKEHYCLIGCTVTPGFNFKDFSLADRQFLLEKFPQHSPLINKFIRTTNTL